MKAPGLRGLVSHCLCCCFFLLAGYSCHSDGALLVPGRLSAEGERAGADHRRSDAEVCAVLRAAPGLPRLGAVLQSCHLLPVGKTRPSLTQKKTPGFVQSSGHDALRKHSDRVSDPSRSRRELRQLVANRKRSPDINQNSSAAPVENHNLSCSSLMTFHSVGMEKGSLAIKGAWKVKMLQKHTHKPKLHEIRRGGGEYSVCILCIL